MNVDGRGISAIEPDLIERRCGGWLAITPRCVAIRIGAVGESEEEARANFAVLIDQWAQARASELLTGQRQH